MIKECWSCCKYKAYFTKGFWKFDKEKNGKCDLQKIVVDKHSCCKQWCSNEIRRKMRREIALKGLIETLKTLAEVNQIILDENEENKINPLPPSRRKL